jgi:hypothetical protein
VRGLRASSLAGFILAALALITAALMGAYVPLKLVELVIEKKLDTLFAGILGLSSIAAGAFLAFFAITLGLLGALAPERFLPREVRSATGEKLAAYRARQRAMLEELDEVKKLLEEIRDLLKEGVGG